jgi:hypothetical protein
MSVPHSVQRMTPSSLLSLHTERLIRGNTPVVADPPRQGRPSPRCLRIATLSPVTNKTPLLRDNTGGSISPSGQATLCNHVLIQEREP